MTVEEGLARAAEILSGATDVALACHLNPDADALGSMLGLADFLRSRGVETTCSFPNEPLDPPRWAALLPGSDRLVPMKDFPKEPAVMITCDCAAFARLRALARLVEVPAAGLVWTYLTHADLAASGVRAAETDDLIDVIRTARGVDVAALVKQQQDGRFKVSVRSRGDHDLAAAATAFGGGGHRLAAGYTSEHGAEETIERLVEVLRGQRVEP